MMRGLCGESNYSPSLLLHMNERIKQAYYLCALVAQNSLRNEISRGKKKKKSLLKGEKDQSANIISSFKTASAVIEHRFGDFTQHLIMLWAKRTNSK